MWLINKSKFVKKNSWRRSIAERKNFTAKYTICNYFEKQFIFFCIFCSFLGGFQQKFSNFNVWKEEIHNTKVNLIIIGVCWTNEMYENIIKYIVICFRAKRCFICHIRYVMKKCGYFEFVQKKIFLTGLIDLLLVVRCLIVWCALAN